MSETGPGTPAPGQPARRGVFRRRALRQYLEGREADVLPPFTSPGTIVALWALLAVAVATLAGARLVHVPVYASGPVVVVRDEPTGRLIAATFVSPGYAARLRPGQPLSFTVAGSPADLHRPVASVLRQILGPASARRRFRLTGPAAAAIRAQVVVVTASLGRVPGPGGPGAVEGAVGRGRIRIGSRRLLDLLRDGLPG